MVRLLQLVSFKIPVSSTWFQSHNGAIAASFGSAEIEQVYISFNPTMVRLLQDEFKVAKEALSGFNPTMVRLLLKNCEIADRQMQSFNPTMVRLLQSKGQR